MPTIVRERQRLWVGSNELPEGFKDLKTSDTFHMMVTRNRHLDLSQATHHKLSVQIPYNEETKELQAVIVE